MFSARRLARGGVAPTATASAPSWRRRGAVALVGPVALALFAAVTPTSAAAQSADAPPEAIEYYRRAREAFESGDYDDAAAALEQALEFDPDSPTLAYNLARVYELMGDLDRALVQYERYQTLLPQQQAREQQQADSTIRRLQGALANNASQPPEAPAPDEVEPLRQLPGIVLVRENGVADAGFWVTLSVGIAALAAGAIFGGLALDASNGVDGFVLGPDGGPTQRVELQDRAELYGAVTDITLGVGGAAVIVAGLLYFLREQTVERAPVGAGEEPQPEVDVDVDADATSARVSLRGAF